ncbi:MAG: OB-fold domain-containing protein [Candidatus Binatia bacterium]
MVGITRIAPYLPRHRLDRAQLGQAWGGRAAGLRTCAGIDEDALTLACDAALACVGDAAPAGIDALYLATTSAPYREKQIASMVATALDLPRTVAVADFGGSVRAGTTALRAALDGVRAGSLTGALVVAADVRLAEPGSDVEALLGDGACAALVGCDGVIAELVSSAAVSEEFTYVFRTDEQRYVQVSDMRFGSTYGYARDVAEAVATALRKAEIPPANVARLALGAPDARAAAEAAKKIGVDAKVLVAPLVAEAGVLGTPDPLVLLSQALETVRPGDFVVVAAYGEGADALVFRATEHLPAARPRPLAEALASGIPLSYPVYLRNRGVLPFEAPTPGPGEQYTTMLEWRELRQDVRFYGSRCEACGLVQYPQARVCTGCRAQERMTEHKLAKRGTVFTYTIDTIAPTLEHPVGMVIVDLDGGGRVYVQTTDAADGEIAVGTPVVLTYRRIGEGLGNRNYYWKARPA